MRMGDELESDSFGRHAGLHGFGQGGHVFVHHGVSPVSRFVRFYRGMRLQPYMERLAVLPEFFEIPVVTPIVTGMHHALFPSGRLLFWKFGLPMGLQASG